MFLIHFSAKVLLMIYLGIWLSGIKFYLYLIMFACIALYMLYTVKTAAASGQETNLQVRNNYLWLVMYIGTVSSLLVIMFMYVDSTHFEWIFCVDIHVCGRINLRIFHFVGSPEILWASILVEELQWCLFGFNLNRCWPRYVLLCHSISLNQQEG